jgi:hypothetical protein
MAEAADSNDKKANENPAIGKLVGFFLFPVALFPLLALISYRWQAIESLQVPPEDSANLIGVAGDVFAYCGYATMGLAIWTVPPLAIFLGLLFVLGRKVRLGGKFLAFLVFLFATTCLLQLLGATPTLAPLLNTLNIAPNAGGAIGYLVMDCALSRLLSPFGASILMASLMAFSLLTMIGLRNILAAISVLMDDITVLIGTLIFSRTISDRYCLEMQSFSA